MLVREEWKPEEEKGWFIVQWTLSLASLCSRLSSWDDGIDSGIAEGSSKGRKASNWHFDAIFSLARVKTAFDGAICIRKLWCCHFSSEKLFVAVMWFMKSKSILFKFNARFTFSIRLSAPCFKYIKFIACICKSCRMLIYISASHYHRSGGENKSQQKLINYVHHQWIIGDFAFAVNVMMAFTKRWSMRSDLVSYRLEMSRNYDS